MMRMMMKRGNKEYPKKKTQKYIERKGGGEREHIRAHSLVALICFVSFFFVCVFAGNEQRFIKHSARSKATTEFDLFNVIRSVFNDRDE
jgi:hypothetical protein